MPLTFYNNFLFHLDCFFVNLNPTTFLLHTCLYFKWRNRQKIIHKNDISYTNNSCSGKSLPYLIFTYICEYNVHVRIEFNLFAINYEPADILFRKLKFVSIRKFLTSAAASMQIHIQIHIQINFMVCIVGWEYICTMFTLNPWFT